MAYAVLLTVTKYEKSILGSQRGNNATNLEMPAIGGLRSFSSVGRGVAGSRAKTLFSPGVLSLVFFNFFRRRSLTKLF